MEKNTIKFIKKICDKRNLKFIKIIKKKVKVYHLESHRYFVFNIDDFILNDGLLFYENTEDWNKKINEKLEKINSKLLTHDGYEKIIIKHIPTGVKYRVSISKIIQENFKPYIEKRAN